MGIEAEEKGRRRPCEDGDRDWVDAAINQGTPGSPEAGRGKQGSSSRGLQTECRPEMPCFWPFGLQNHERVHFSCFQPPHLCSFITFNLGHYWASLVKNLPALWET